MSAYTDVTKSQALNAFLRTGGDFTQTHRVMRSEIRDKDVPAVATLKLWSEQYMWEATLIQVRNRLQADAARNALAELRRDLAFLETAKSRLMEEIGGKYDEDGLCIRTPLEAKSLESACTAMVRVMEAQNLLRGEESKHDKQEAENLILMLAKTALGIKPEGGDNVIPLPGTEGDRRDSTGDEPKRN